MSMSTHVVGIKPPDEKWKEMKKVWDACEKAKVDVPKEVDDFFDGIDPDPKGVIVELDAKKGVKEYNAESQQGLEVELDKLPKGIKIIRFVNSW